MSESGGSNDAEQSSQETKGWLYKWTNYIKGYQKRWFVLVNGLLYYYRNQAEMARACRGSISLNGAVIFTEDSCNFIVSNAGGTQTYHLKASNEVERQRWITALELAKAKAIQHVESEDEEAVEGVEAPAEIDKQELNNIVKILSIKLEDLQTCHGLMEKHGHALQRSLGDLEVQHQNGNSQQQSSNVSQSSATAKSSTSISAKDLTMTIKSVNERATLFNITCCAMMNASKEFLELCQSNGKRWIKVLDGEREIRLHLEDMVQQFAKQHSHLESIVRKEYTANQVAGECDSNMVMRNSGIENPGTTVETSSPAEPAHSHHKTVSKPFCSQSGSDDEDLFEDAIDTSAEVCFNVPVPPGHRRTSSNDSATCYRSESSAVDEDDDRTSDDDDNGSHQTGHHHHHHLGTFNVVQRKTRFSFDSRQEDCGGQQRGQSNDNPSAPLVVNSNKASESTGGKELGVIKKRRDRIPDKPNISISLWSIMKNCIGKDLSKIPVPVNFSEPLSMLQRLTEDFEYSEILDEAATRTLNSCEQMAYVAAFTVSSYSTTAIRTGKPFNPLLGETYECDRSNDKGFRCFNEQVSHHPPMVAQYCESSKGLWRCWQEFTMRSRFKGKYLEVEPLGIAHLEFPSTGNHYTWRKVKTVVHNIVIGKLWIDQHGEMEVINHLSGDKCHMKFEPYSYFGGVSKKVTGTIVNRHDKVEWVVNGSWDSKLEASPVISETTVKGKSSLEIDGAPRLLWKAHLPHDGAKNFYNFTKFACELNEEEVGVAPTDSRLRPDQRLMELGEWDAANREKVRLEEKQRAAKRKSEAECESAGHDGRNYDAYQPLWFKRTVDEQNGQKLIHTYTNVYWEAKANQDWSRCPDIF